ncbi:MAG TPA: decarboxylating 6-phosphogluconate dehydrogenase [Steroidobacteraceae bacterium]|nr:decarboxylating 6-phosphogluconate dehydrogenase [Steroidobacteraceae bacterium]
MRIGMVGLGRMGANMVRRLMKGGHQCVAYDRSREAVQALAAEGAVAANSLAELVKALTPPRAVWIMVPAALVDSVIAELRPLLAAGDILVDGGNSHYQDDIRRAEELRAAGLHYVDAGTSGGVLGLEQGYCLMIGAEPAVFNTLEPIFATLSPGGRRAQGQGGKSPARAMAEMGYLHCGPNGAGHFVKMVHNGIEYGVMAAYAEGLNLLRHANAGATREEADAETAPLSNPRLFQYELDMAAVAEVWRHGSIISSRLLDLTAEALAADPVLGRFGGRVSDSGEGRWTVQAAVEIGVPAHVLAAALFSRFESRGRAEFADKLLSAMRLGFGGHLEKAKSQEAILDGGRRPEGVSR